MSLHKFIGTLPSVRNQIIISSNKDRYILYIWNGNLYTNDEIIDTPSLPITVHSCTHGQKTKDLILLQDESVYEYNNHTKRVQPYNSDIKLTKKVKRIVSGPQYTYFLYDSGEIITTFINRIMYLPFKIQDIGIYGSYLIMINDKSQTYVLEKTGRFRQLFLGDTICLEEILVPIRQRISLIEMHGEYQKYFKNPEVVDVAKLGVTIAYLYKNGTTELIN